MPWGFECRAKLIKQNPAKPTHRKNAISAETSTPGPDYYEPPKVSGGKGYSKIKRSPAYTFGYKTNACNLKPAASLNAPLLDVRGISAKGTHRIPGGLLIPHIDPPGSTMKVPGPGSYDPMTRLRTKRVPAYSMRPAAKPPYQPFDAWTPPPNMYCPPIPKATAPSYTLGYPDRTLAKAYIPGPGEHEPNYKFVQKSKPAYSFGATHRELPAYKTPAPNTYCEKKFNINRRSVPAPSFGIRHSPFLGKEPEFLKSSKLDLRLSQI
ncbi:outer dense fiber protein 3-like protein 2 [Trichoplusia ni]|uniref:Outer dense fiber protein 3-like protein 2 n=1 Tax=Trichoplusia ni TaxID=7111 RepID=A0A7E5WF94_TRINI|nr:outer dense fiber protein 3-like protein 2 [Trichoplusia ni]